MKQEMGQGRLLFMEQLDASSIDIAIHLYWQHALNWLLDSLLRVMKIAFIVREKFLSTKQRHRRRSEKHKKPAQKA
jgi:hypothetical protein